MLDDILNGFDYLEIINQELDYLVDDFLEDYYANYEDLGVWND